MKTDESEYADKTASQGYINYSGHNFTDIFDTTNNNENQQSSSSDNEKDSDNGSNENETNKVPSERKTAEKAKMDIVKTKT